MPIQFGADYIDRLNRTSDKGKFLKTVILTESVSPSVVKSYWVDHEDPIVFEGQTYTPLRMYWEGIKTSVGMPTEGVDIGLSNIGNHVVKYIKEIDISGNEVILQLIHLDLLSTLTNYWKRQARVLAVRADINAAMFTVGRELARNRLPRRLIMDEEVN